ncbi:MAG TPA: TIGR01244 family sulfur transferase [Beijerinckiaceae bacterium]|jgi:uncharacterized protein (TIGR01244 family)
MMQDLPRFRTVLAVSLVIGAGTVLVPASLEKLGAFGTAVERRSEPSTAMRERQRLTRDLFVAGQIDAGDIAHAKSLGFRTVIALRPDGEAAGQPDSVTMGVLVRESGLAFAYVPVPQGELPDAVADALGAALARAEGPVLLYCRSGRRAARAWAVAEASRPGGLALDDIQAAAAGTGHAVDDLAARLAERHAQRAPRG